MVRDLGARRQPAFVLTLGAGLIFLALCWILHRRERVLTPTAALPLSPQARHERAERAVALSSGEDAPVRRARTPEELEAERARAARFAEAVARDRELSGV